MEFEDSLGTLGSRNSAYRQSDLELGDHDKGKSQGIGGTKMVRMFKRLLRGGSRPRVVGGWIW